MIKKSSHKKTHLNEGCQAPLFRFKDECGQVKSLADMKGKNIILFFYPKDLTPSCTSEACDLRDNYNILLGKGFYLIGISADEEKRHEKFRQKYSLPFPLVADTDKAIINAYGVWGPKQFMGLKYEGILRTTFIIDESGIIKKVISKVKSKQHTNQILTLLNLN